MSNPPETRYAEGIDGLVAYQVLGDGPIDLLYLSWAASQVDVRLDFPLSAQFLERLASFSRLILFDRRGTGASDRVALDALPTREEWADATIHTNLLPSDRGICLAARA